MPSRLRAPSRTLRVSRFSLRPIRRSHIYEEILAQLGPLIHQQGGLQGAKLPPERELARTLGVSRTSLREAIRILTVQGVLEPRPGRGTLINESNPSSLASIMASLLSPGELQARHVMEFRKALEPDIAAAAATRASAVEIQTLDAILARTAEKVARNEPAVEEDAQFHHALAASTRNPAFVQVVARCMDLIQATRQRVLQTSTRNRASWEGHRRIMEAVRNRDPDAAYAAMLGHLEEVDRLITELLRRRLHP